MDDKLKVFWNLDVLVKMSRSKSDGPSLRVEEEEIETKLRNYKQEIDEINSISEEEIYDTSAEMADRNIEIITKKHLQSLKSELKEKNKELTRLKEEETLLYNQNSLLRENKKSQEKYMLSMQERIGESTSREIIDRYNALIAETAENIAKLEDELISRSTSYEDIQNKIIEYTDLIGQIEDNIEKKKKLLNETQVSLEHKENYIDKAKKEKNTKRINDLESKIQTLESRLTELRKDPKYLESRIKEIINNKEEITNIHPFLIELLNQVIRIPYINVPTNNALEEELLKATQARDSFANEIDQKSYNILEANTPEKVRTEFLNLRISKWKEELEELNKKILLVDTDAQYNYEAKDKQIYDMISVMKKDYQEFQRAYDETPDTSIGAKARLKASLEEKKEDIIEAEKIATLFKKDEAEDIENATNIIKYECERINEKIRLAEEEIVKIKNRLTSKKSGLIDITSKNKDKDILKELAQIVIDIKHRRQFPETPVEIIHRLEESLEMNLMKDIDESIIISTNSITPRNYDEYIMNDEYEMIDSLDEDFSDMRDIKPTKRGIKVISEAEITIPAITLESPDKEEVVPAEDLPEEKIDEEQEENSKETKEDILNKAINEIEKNENKDKDEETTIEDKDEDNNEEVNISEIEETRLEDIDSFASETSEETSEEDEKEKDSEQDEESAESEQNVETDLEENSEQEDSSSISQEEQVEEKHQETTEESSSKDNEENPISEAEELITDSPIEEDKKTEESISQTEDVENNNNLEEEQEMNSQESEPVETETNKQESKEEVESTEDDIELSIDSIFNPQQKYEELQKNKNMVSSEDLTNELDQYINSLDSNEN